MEINLKQRIYEVNEPPLFAAFKSNDINLSVLQALVDQGEDVNSKDIEGNSLMHYAFLPLSEPGISKVRYLINQNCKIDVTNNANQKPKYVVLKNNKPCYRYPAFSNPHKSQLSKYISILKTD